MSGPTSGKLLAQGNLILLDNRADYRELIATTAKMLNAESNAERLALCWNSHDELLAALKDLVMARAEGKPPPVRMWEAAIAAIAKAEA